jgi:glycosyltransferase involved in cell wall biosynthesis
MRLVIIADTFPPLKTSGAVQIRDLCLEFLNQGHLVTVLLPSNDIKVPWTIENFNEIQLIRLKAPKIKDINYFWRTVNETLTPFSMYYNLKKSKLGIENWDGVVWYSPSIFLAPLANIIKKKNKIKAYLIIRDIFPNWAVDMGLISKYSLINLYFSLVAKYQYSVADFIGVQTDGNLIYFKNTKEYFNNKIQVLHNWLGNDFNVQAKIRISKTKLANCKVFIYAGNMGVAQGLNLIIDLAKHFSFRKDIGFLFVGRGGEVSRLKNKVVENKIDNVLFCDEINPNEIADLYAQCVAGIVSLDSRHKSHNIPGKFLTYMQNGLPVLAKINKGNDLERIIQIENVGQVSVNDDIDELIRSANILLDQIESDPYLPVRCIELFNKKFNVKYAVNQIIDSLFT